MPLLSLCAALVPDSGRLIALAGIQALALFAGLALAVFRLREDGPFLAPLVCVGGTLALGLVAAVVLGGVTLGVWSFGVFALLAGLIVVETSHVLLTQRTDQYVSAALLLLAAGAVLFLGVVRLLMLVMAERD